MEFMFVIPLPVEDYDPEAKAAHPDEEQYEVIEGSHRWKVLMELGHGEMLWQVRKIKVMHVGLVVLFLLTFLLGNNSTRCVVQAGWLPQPAPRYSIPPCNSLGKVLPLSPSHQEHGKCDHSQPC